MLRFAAIATLSALAALAAGCASPPSRFYTLSGTATPAATSSNLSVAVGPVSIPAEVDRPEIVVSTGPNQVQLDEFNRWASPLQDNIARVIAENLVAMLGTPRVALFPQTLSADADYRVAIEVQTFRSAPGEAAVAGRDLDRAPGAGRQNGDAAHHRARGGPGERLRCARRRSQPRARTPVPGHRRRRACARSLRAALAGHRLRSLDTRVRFRSGSLGLRRLPNLSQ